MSVPTPPLPNFFIGGAPNTGTTSLYFYLRQHPQVYMSPVKEPTYFGAAEFFAERAAAGPAPRVGWGTRLRRWLKRPPKPMTWESYLALFRDARAAHAIGEASVRYLVLPAAARSIRSRLPQARLIFVLRNPADWLHTRYLSRFWRDPPGRFADRFRTAMDPSALWAPALRIGRYGTHLQRYYDLFPREQIRVFLYEELQADARAVLRNILTFLDVDPDYPVDMSYRHNVSVVPRFRAFQAVRWWLLRDAPVIQWLPPAVRRRLRELYYRRRPALVMDSADRRMVIDHYRDEIERAAGLIQRDLSAWLR